jgi:hypothetical protein
MEDPRTPCISSRSVGGVDCVGAAWCDPERADLPVSFDHFQEESKRFDVSTPWSSLLLTLLFVEALAASTVKVAGRDVLGSWKVLISLGAAPLLYIFYAILATIVATKAGVPLKWRLWTPFVVISALPFIGYAALKFGEAGMDVLK